MSSDFGRVPDAAAAELGRTAEEGYGRMLDIGRKTYSIAAAAGCEEFALVEDYRAEIAVAVGIRIDEDDDGGIRESLIVCEDGRLLAGPVSVLRIEAPGRWSAPARERRIDGRRVLYVSASDWIGVGVRHPGSDAVQYPPVRLTSAAILVEVDPGTGELTTSGFGDYSHSRLIDVMAARVARITDRHDE